MVRHRRGGNNKLWVARRRAVRMRGTHDAVATAELDAARNAEECDDADALALMALSRS